MASEPLLQVQGLTCGYGQAVVLSDVSFTLEAGRSLALLGRNGTGKTTLIDTLVGVTTRHAGRIVLNGRAIEALPVHQRAGGTLPKNQRAGGTLPKNQRAGGTLPKNQRAAGESWQGLGWVPQERNIFRSLTVEENLSAVARPGPWSLARVFELFPRLAERRRNLGTQLSGGEQQMLAFARALVLNPKLLLLDEPLEGLAPIIVEELLRAIRRVAREEGLSSIVVEQHPHLVLSVTDDAVLLDRGGIAYRSDSRTLIEQPALLDPWLGVAASH
ncbi:MAG: ATP-binding cassette domain-containing protein [Rubrivivax sp.]|nr:ATP-binding cassette domain-containing protein [Rubrivivax sp.]